jgi:hypothetical protein
MDNGDLREQIVRLEADLAETIESCRKVILISKAIIAVGGILILAMLLGMFGPMIMISAIAAIMGPPSSSGRARVRRGRLWPH